HTYQLLESPEYIRLIVLEPALYLHAPLVLAFKHGHLSDVIAQYEAISYTWGAPKLIYPVFVNDGTHVMVTENLDQALRFLKKPTAERILWADAICIDQSSNEDKSNQIPLMTKIFRNASRVLAWVGGGTEEEQGMHILDSLTRKWGSRVEIKKRSVARDDFKSVDLEPMDDGDRLHIRAFLSLTWFTRLWIVQEVVFNVDIVFLCGNTVITWIRLAIALEVLQSTSAETVAFVDDGKIQALHSIAKLWKHHCLIDDAQPQEGLAQTETHILSVIETFRNYACTDARDRIFAVYSMTDDIQPTQFEKPGKQCIWMDVDYSLDILQTFQAFA
ncbi:heterokaryon incompatibility protein-domain-containing protein, partial [Phaeosphaeriaceae sp. PMI808]